MPKLATLHTSQQVAAMKSKEIKKDEIHFDDEHNEGRARGPELAQ
jgi:hypothetical protein